MNNFGARFSLYPMTDNFIPVILGSLGKTDTSAVYSFTDAISTVYRGNIDSVLDGVSALFINAFTDGVHMAIEGQFSNEEEVKEVAAKPGETPNKTLCEDIHFPVKCKLNLYGAESAKGLYEVIKARCTLEKEEISYGTRFAGDVQDVYTFIAQLCKELDSRGEKFTLHFTMNCNSPTAE